MPKAQREKERQAQDAESVFHAEIEVAKRAREIAQRDSISKKELQAEYEALIEQYEKLLQQTAKITRISDGTQLKLRRAQEALNALNAELARALKIAEEQQRRAEEASKFKTELLSIAAHDLKNPLQSIMGFASLIQESDDSKSKEYARIIHGAAQRMTKLINELLNTTAIDAGKFNLDRQAYSLGELASVVVAANLQQANAKDQRIDFYAEPNCVASVDAERMREVLDNLVSNAIKYSPKGKTIWVRVQRAVSQDESAALPVIRISVKDEGQGLSEDDMKKVFGRFQRLSARPTGGESSTGLGLSIAKQLVELHDGKIWVESQGKDKGATFIVELPVLPENAA